MVQSFNHSTMTNANVKRLTWAALLVLSIAWVALWGYIFTHGFKVGL